MGLEAHKYASPEEIYNGEIGELHGVRFIENFMAPVLGGTSYKNKAEGVTYATYFFGKDAFGIIDPAGGGAEMIIKDKGTVGGPLEQFSTVGYKFETNGATILYPERVLRVMSVSSYSATDSANDRRPGGARNGRNTWQKRRKRPQRLQSLQTTGARISLSRAGRRTTTRTCSSR